ncbi:non-ribosomal peptide synthetase [Methylocapsa acidiphila]|uniref:non-ribosomal peptide synthetase n=1 Tax=Methylocapsa acidiphila TaxID=133552 RepID=UPI0018DDA6C6|nr:non-ribosomal peptide synthetase [Methylocapsa acidiphila]
MSKLTGLSPSKPSLSPAKAALLEKLLQGRLAAAPAADVIQRRPPGPAPLSFAQQRLWTLAQIEPRDATYNIPAAFLLSGRLDLRALQRCLEEICRRHESLRTRFETSDGAVVQIVDPPGPTPLQEEDLTHLPEDERRAKALRLAQEDALRPFDLAAGPLVRFRLWRLSGAGGAAPSDYVLFANLHHIIADGWSIDVLTREISEIYRAFAAGAPSPLPEPAIQYVDFASWQRGQLQGDRLASELDYWRLQLEGHSGLLDLPRDHLPAHAPRRAGASHAFRIEEPVARGLRDLARREEATLFMVLLAGFYVLLHRTCGETDLCVASPVANRSRLETEGLIGCFVNTLVLRTELAGNPTFVELLRRVRETALGAQAHQDLPFERIVEDLRPERALGRNPLAQAMLTLQNPPARNLALPDLQLTAIELSTETAKFDLSLGLTEESDGGLSGALDYAADLFSTARASRMAEQFSTLLEAAMADPTRTIADLPLLSDMRRRTVLDLGRRTECDWGAQGFVPELIEARCRERPFAPALVSRAEETTYGDLARRANRLAHGLIARGVGAEDIVAIYARRSVEFVIAALGIMKAGAAFLPLDPEQPPLRLAATCADAHPKAALVQAGLVFPEGVCDAPALPLDAAVSVFAEAPEENPSRPCTPGQLAYVLFTSGSTGRPKGVGIPHEGLRNRLLWMRRDLAVSEADSILHKTSVGFDVSVWEYLLPLICGARVIVADPADHRDPERIAELVARHGVTILHFVPSMLAGFLDLANLQACASLRHLVCSGEALPPELKSRCQKKLPGRLHNYYGPTEATIDVSAWECGAEDDAPIGHPVANTELYILDGRLAPAPIGVAGELYAAGVQLARGYVGRPDLTAAAFLPNPFGAPGSRMYRTGDRARWREDGGVDYLGRLDGQVKIRGHRIELGEIEAALMQCEGVTSAVVVATNEEAGRRLAAYIVGDAEPEALREALARRLPDYMTPTFFQRLESLPLTANGKIDRKALPIPDAQDAKSASYAAPRTVAEAILVGIWADALGLPRVGIHDNFFEIGGHSLLAVQVIAKMRQEGLRTDVRALFMNPTPAGLAAALGDAAEFAVPPNRIPEGCGAITPDMLPLMELTQTDIDRIIAGVPGGAANVQDIYPLAPLQEGIFFHHLMAAEGDPYLLRTLVSFDSRERLEAFLGAWQAVIARHDILRTAVVWEGLPEPAQVVQREAPLTVEEVCFDPADGAVAEQIWTRFDPRRLRLDLRRAPMQRGVLTRDDASGRWLLLLLTHHLAMDHRTLEIAVEEAQEHLLGRSDLSAAPTTPFRNFVAQARLAANADEDEAFFTDMLGDVTEPTAPFGMLDVQGDGSGVAEAGLALDESLALRLRARARVLGASPASLCHLAFAQVLARVCGRDDVVFGSVLFGRMQGGAGVDRAIGMFINTLPVRIRIGAETVAASAWRMHQLLAGLFRREHASLALAQRCSKVPAPAPLFSALLNYRHSPAETEKSNDAKRAWEGVEVLHAEERTNYPLTLSVDDFGEGFRLTAQTQNPIDPARLCAFMRVALERLVDALETAPDTAARAIDVLGAEEHRLISAQRGEGVSFAHAGSLAALFEAQAALRPEAVAVSFGDASLSYGGLNASANRLARHLRRLGVGPEVRVGLRLERSPAMIVAILAVIKAGGAYVPLDPAHPQERLAWLAEDASLALLLTEEALRANCPEHWPEAARVPLLRLDRDAALWADEPEDNLADASLQDQLAYVIYTSGSTGKPKGVLVSQRNLVRLFAATQEFGFGPDDVWTLFHSTAFDFSVWEMWGALLHGGRLVVTPYWASRDPEAFYDLLRREKVTVLNQTPSAFRQLLASEAFAAGRRDLALRLVIFGGEALDPACLLPWLARYGDARPRLVNMYGITETTVHVTQADQDLALAQQRRTQQHAAQQHTTQDQAGGLIGRPLPDLSAYLLDDALRPVPQGVEGELYIGGAGLARGYHNRPDLTAERFIPDPFGGAGARLYKTGDRARLREDGRLDYLGRIDLQVKIRGHRVELGEIEAAIRLSPNVEDAVVVQRKDNASEARLAAYVVGAWDVDELRAELRRALPDYMVPADFVRMDALPLTANGKIDRRTLPIPDAQDALSISYAAPRTEIEAILAGIWADALGLLRVGVHDNFFEIGGHSLSATKLVARIRRDLGAEIALRALFEAPTVAEIARLIPHSGASARPERIGEIGRGLRAAALAKGDPLPLSFAQQRLWFLDRLEPASPFYNIGLALRLTGRLDVLALERSLRDMARRHESLRTCFPLVDGRPIQSIAPEPTLRLARGAVEGESKQDWAESARRLISAEAQMSFDLASGPLIRARLLEPNQQQAVDDEQHVLILTLHHSIADGWSLDIMLREIAQNYEAVRSSLDASHADLPVQYADYTLWQRAFLEGAELDRQLAYWRRRLADAPELLALPTDKPRPLEQSYAGAICRLPLPPGLIGKIDALARQNGATRFVTLLAAFNLLLARYSGQDDICVGTPVANRRWTELEGLIGCFVNMLALRADLSGNPRFTELLARVRAVTLEAQDHQDLPFERLVTELGLARDLGRNPLFQVCFAAENKRAQRIALDDLAIEPIEVETTTAMFDLSLDVVEDDDNAFAVFEYNSDLFLRATIEGLAANYIALVESIVARPDARINAFPTSTPQEGRALLELGAGAAAEPGPAADVVSLIEASARRFPDRPAVADGEYLLTYRDLNIRANRLAHRLITLGAGPEAIVGVHMERSIALVVALLAVLKTGAAYAPLDPEYPAERLRATLEDCRPALVLSSSRKAHEFAAGSPVLDPEADVCLDCPESDPAVQIDGRMLAYVLFTSGSTGRPKGVAVPHAALANRIAWGLAQFDLGPADVMLQRTSASFDVSAWEIFGAIAAGASLAIAGPEAAADPDQLVALIRRHGVTAVELVPSLLRALMLSPRFRDCRTLRVVCCGGEAMSDLLRAEFQAAHNARLFNMYGPTETTVDASFWNCGASADDPTGDGCAPIGQPIRDARLYVLDRALNLAPRGAIGELYIGGAGLARGYYERPGLTAASFIPDPFGDPGGRLYRSGDLARWRADGLLEFRGRVDRQVKLRGFRIELEEVEARLAEAPGVRAAAVVVEADRAGEGRLVAYVATSDSHATQESVRRYARSVLPNYMAPAVIVLIDELPLDANGKIRRSELSRPGSAAHAQAGEIRHDPPIGAFESRIAEIWAEVLGLPRVGRSDGFFELGGHSLLAVRLAALLGDRLQIEVPLAAVFQYPTVAALAERLRAKRESGTSPLVVIREGRAPLYVFHTGVGHVQGYQPLIAALDPRDPVIGVQMRALENPEMEAQDFESATADYAEALRSRHPGGAYRLLGWSLGGLLALGVAARLRDAGDEIGFLGLVDVDCPQKLAMEDWAGRLMEFLHDPEDRARLAALPKDLTAEAGRLFARVPCAERAATAALWGREKGLWLNEASIEALSLETKLWRHVAALEDTFAPPRFAGDLHLWLATRGLAVNGAARVDWAALSGARSRVETIEGDHFSIVASPRLHASLREILAALDEREGRDGQKNA